MNGVLARYLRRRVGMQTFALLALLTALMQVLELLDVTTDVLDRNLGIAGLVRYAWLRLPSEVVLSLPLAVLLGAMSAFHAMSRSREIVAIRCVGVSLKRVLVLLLPVPALFAMLQFALSERVVPPAETALKSWWDSTAPPDEGSEPTWVRTSVGPVSFDDASFDGRVLKGLRLYTRGADGLFASRVTARSAAWDGQDWILQGVQELAVRDGAIRRDEAAERRWHANLRPDDVTRLDVARPHLSSIMLADVIVGERVGAQPLSYYQTVLWHAFTAPVGVFIMLLLAVPPAGRMARGEGGSRLLLALALGLGFLLCDGLMSALGASGRVPAFVAALAAPLLFTAIGIVQLHSCDRS